MPANSIAGELFPWQMSADVVAQDITNVLFQWKFINRYPLYTRIRRRPCGQVEFTQLGQVQRPEYVTLAAAVADNTVTTMTFTDVSYVLNGDTLEYVKANGDTEMMEVIQDPNVTANTMVVLRQDAGTTGGAMASGDKLRLIANSRTGGELNQRGISPTTSKNLNWIQSMQHPVEVAGITMDTDLFRTELIEAGATDPLDAIRMRALRNMVRDTENMLIYQRGISPLTSSTKRAKTRGIRQQIKDVPAIGAYTPYQWQPTDFAAYSPNSFVRDVLMGPAGQGGAPDLCIMSTDWIAGLAMWKTPMVRIDMGVTEFDIRIDGFKSDVAPDMLFLKDPSLRAGTLIACEVDNLTLRYMRLPFFKPRGSQGDAFQGDVIQRVGIQLDYPEQARFLEGITGFAAA